MNTCIKAHSETKVRETIWVNGESVAFIAASDRGLAYGDGLFETIRLVGGRQSLEKLHWGRLAAGASRLGIDLDIPLAKREVLEFLRWAGAGEGVLKVMVTRGSGGRGYNAAGCDQPRRILSLHPLPTYPESLPYEGIQARLCELRLGQSCLAGVKHLNRLEQVLARAEWNDPACYEGLLMDFDGWLVEGTMSNLFIVDNSGLLITPRLNNNGVAGVCRQYILENASSWGVPVQENNISLAMLASAREVFVCNSVNGVWPVVACDVYRWPVGTVTGIIRDRVVEVFNA